MRVVGYCRISVEEKDGSNKNCSIAAQEERIRGYCQLYGLELQEVIHDVGQSAKSLNRQGIQRALVMLEAGNAEGLVIAKLDRLTRSLADWQHLIKRYFGAGQATLLSVADQIDTRTASGACVLNILVSISEWERRAIGERVAVSLAYKRKQGIHVGRAPYGSKISAGRLIDDSDEKRNIELVLSMRAAGKTLSEIAAEFTAQAIPSKRGGKWHASTIRSLLQRNSKNGGEPVCQSSQNKADGVENDRDRGENAYLKQSA